MKRQQTIINEINKLFPAANEKYPICFIRDDQVIVSGECEFVETFQGQTLKTVAIDYWGNGWIHSKLEAYAKALNCYWEWENAACIVLCEI